MCNVCVFGKDDDGGKDDGGKDDDGDDERKEVSSPSVYSDDKTIRTIKLFAR